jgi:hypothetical protein
MVTVSALVVLQRNVALCPCSMADGDASNETVGVGADDVGGGGGVPPVETGGFLWQPPTNNNVPIVKSNTK